MYKKLKGLCKLALDNNLCLGCNLLELENFENNPKCKYINNKDTEAEQLTLNQLIEQNYNHIPRID